MSEIGFGVALRVARRVAGLTQEQLADRASVAVRTVRNLEAGSVHRPRAETVGLLADALGLPGEQRAAFLAAALSEPPGSSAPPGSPAGTPLAVPRQLPAPPSHFVGRRDELVALRAAAARGGPRVVVLLGAAGVGKSALAVQGAHEVAGEHVDGHLFADLHGFDPRRDPLRPEECLARFLRALGVPGAQVPGELDEQTALYRSLLAGRHALVVLDNARTADQVRPLLPGSSSCLVLVTSRTRLGGLVVHEGAAEVELGGLSPADSVALLATVLGDRRVADEPVEAARLARSCGHLPLALAITAANLRSNARTSLARAAAALETGDRLSSMVLDGDATVAVEGALDLSYRALDAPVRSTLRRLGLLPAVDVDPYATAALAGLPVDRARQHLEVLATAHLVERRETDRYGMHDLTRLYASRRALADEPEAARDEAVRRALAYYLRAGDAAAAEAYPRFVRLVRPAPVEPVALPPFPEGALGWLERERSTIVAVARYVSEHGPRPFAWHLADALRGFFYLRKHYAEWDDAARAGLRAAEHDGDLAAQAAMHTSIGQHEWSRSRYAPAAERFQTALELYRAAGWPEGESSALGNLGGVHINLGRLRTAHDYFTEALTLSRALGSPRGEAHAASSLSNVLSRMGCLRAAMTTAERALALHTRLGSRDGQSSELNKLGLAYLDLGETARARDHVTRALGLARESGSRDFEANCLDSLAQVLAAGGDPGAALAHVRGALAIAVDIGDLTTRASALVTAGAVHLERRRTGAADECFREALAICSSTGDRCGEIDALTGSAGVRRVLGDLPGSVRAAEEARELAAAAGYQVRECRALHELAATSLRLGAHATAVSYARQALELYGVTGLRRGLERTEAVLRDALTTSQAAGPR